MGNVESIKSCLNNKNGEKNRQLLMFCKEPKTYNEITKSGIKGDLFSAIAELKKCGAIAFSDGKYFATKEGLEALSSS
jgi:hypothetical protein